MDRAHVVFHQFKQNVKLVCNMLAKKLGTAGKRENTKIRRKKLQCILFSLICTYFCIKNSMETHERTENQEAGRRK